MTKWQKVYEVGSPVRAEIVKGILEKNEILAIIIDKKESAYQIHGYYEVLVPGDQVFRAVNIIENEITF